MWPKTISIKGIAIQVESWEELDEIIQRYGGDIAISADNSNVKAPKPPSGGSLAMNDRVLLQQFVDTESKGILNKDLGKFLGSKGKSIGPALRKWGLRIGLAHDEKAEAFERFNRPDGRGYRLSAPFTKVAQNLLAEKE